MLIKAMKDSLHVAVAFACGDDLIRARHGILDMHIGYVALELLEAVKGIRAALDVVCGVKYAAEPVAEALGYLEASLGNIAVYLLLILMAAEHA